MNIKIHNKVFILVTALIMMSVITAAHARRGIEEIKDPYELFYAVEGKITKAQARKLIKEVINSSRKPSWTQRKGQRGKIRAEAERGRLYAAVDIIVSNEGIKIHYVDSERMRYRQRKDKRYIRNIYNKWVKSLAKQISQSARSKYKAVLVSSKKRKLLKGLAAGKKLVVIAVRALPDVRPVRNGPKWSAQIGESLADKLNKKFGNKHLFDVLEWNRVTLNYVKSGYKKSYNMQACDANDAQGVITVGVVIDSTETDGPTSSEEVSLTYFDCDTEELLVKTVEAEYKNTDKFDLQTGTIYQVSKMLSETGL